MNRGKFIVLEGGDGAGKDTQMDLLKEDFKGEDFLFVRDPGGTAIGEKIREVVLFDKQVSPKAELLLYLASRAQLTEEVIEPALQKGVHVFSLRYDLSTIAYQIYGRERESMKDFLLKINEFIRGEAHPDLLIYLDCPTEEGLRRVMETRDRIDRFEKEKIAFHERVRRGYQEHIGDYKNHLIVDGTQSIEEVYTEVHEAVSNAL